MTMRTVSNETAEPVAMSWCVNPDHWSGEPGVHDDDAVGHDYAVHTISPGGTLTYSESINADAIDTLTSVSGMTRGA